MTIHPQTLTLLRDLVAFNSVTPDDGGCFDYIADYVSRLGGTVRRIDRNQTTNLIATFGNGPLIFAFAGHVDVVPSGEAAQWINGNPFCLHQDNELLIGRGVADMKGGIAAFLVALGEFMERAKPDSYRIMLLLTSDEEGCAIDGTPLIVEHLQAEGIRLNYCLVGEPSCATVFGDTLKIGRRGSLTGSLLIHGKQGHIAYPHLCVNPIHRALPALSELSQLEWDQGTQFFPPSSFQLANINAGLGVSNVIPGTLSCDFNFRYNNLHTAESLQTRVEQLLNHYQLNYSIEWRNSAQPFLTPVDTLVKVASQSILRVTGQEVALKTDGGTSDGRFLIALSDELIEFGLRNDSIHQINEATTLNDLLQLKQVYALILAKLFSE